MTEQELILRLQQREELAFKELVDRFQHKVFNTALGLVQNPNDAEDIAQEVFIQVYRSINEFKGNATLSTWIYRITVTRSIDQLRSKKRKKRFGFISGLFGETVTTPQQLVNFQHPGVMLDKKEDAAILFKMVAQLPASQKTAFILNKVEGLGYNEVAAILNTTESAVDSLLQRAKQNLRKALHIYLDKK